MNYITHHGYKGKYLSGDGEVYIPYRTPVKRSGNAITCAGYGVICLTSSYACHRHFSRDDDGQGILRGRLTYSIAFEPRNAGNGYRLSDDEQIYIRENYAHWLKDLPDAILFNDDFFDADIDELKKLATYLKIGW